MIANARIERCAYPVLNGDESSIFCVSLQVAQNLATTFLRYHQPEPACRPTTTTSSCETFLISHETQNIENADKSHSLN
jgi:hypothetical protein